LLSGYIRLPCFAYGIRLPNDLTRILGAIPLLIVFGFALFDNYLWRTKLLLPLVRQPLLAGTWHGTLTSYRRDKNDKKIQTEHEVILVIRQTYTNISLTQITEESLSRSSAAQVIMRQKDDYQVQYQYLNEPTMEYRDHSPIHTGGSTIQVGGSRPTRVTGEYWTARDTRGTYTVERVSDSHATSLAEGLQMAAEKESTK